jgi:hypothetical protein
MNIRKSKLLNRRLLGLNMFKLTPQISWLRERSFDYSVENARPLKDLRPSSLPENLAESIKNNPSLMPEVDIVCSHEDEEWRFYPILRPPTPECEEEVAQCAAVIQDGRDAMAAQWHGISSAASQSLTYALRCGTTHQVPELADKHGWVTKMVLLMVLQPYPRLLGPMLTKPTRPKPEKKDGGV